MTHNHVIDTWIAELALSGRPHRRPRSVPSELEGGSTEPPSSRAAFVDRVFEELGPQRAPRRRRHRLGVRLSDRQAASSVRYLPAS